VYTSGAIILKENRSEILGKLKELISKIADFEEVNKAVTEALGSEIDPFSLVNALSEALEEVGKKYESGEYFLSELMMAGYLASQVANMLKPYLVRTTTKTFGKIVFGTVKGDIHDIGKNIVIMLLKAAGFDVIDLGVDVPAEKFAEAVREHNPDILAMSALLTVTMPEMKNVIDVLKENGLRDRIKVIVGGRPVTPEFADEIGADGYAEDAVKAVSMVKKLVGVKEG